MPEFCVIFAQKTIKMPKFFYYIFPQINKIHEFFMTFACKMPEFYVIIGRKNIFPNLGRVGARASPIPPPPFPTPMTIHYRCHHH